MQDERQPMQQNPPRAAGPARPFTWGVVGAGGIGRQFAADLALLPGTRIGAVASRSETSALAFMQAAGAARAYAGLAELVADDAIDAVYLATPNALHAEQALAVLAAKKPVLVEKPLATSSGDAARIADLAARNRCFAMEALWTRFLPAVEAARALLAAEAIGEVVHIDADLSYRKDENAAGRFFDPALGGGSALDLGVYPLSLAVHFLGLPERFSGRWWAAKSGVDRRCVFELSFAGATASLSCGFDREGANVFTIRGSRGALRLEAPFLKAQKLTVFGPGSHDLPLVGARAVTGGIGKLLARLPLPGRKQYAHRFPGNGLQFEAAAVMQALRRGETQSQAMPLSQSVGVLEIIETVLAQPPQAG